MYLLTIPTTYERSIPALAAQHRWKVHHLDVKSTFLNGDLREEMYVAKPEGFVIKTKEYKVYKLSNTLYGLRQAPRAWNIRLDKSLKISKLHELLARASIAYKK